MQPSPRPLSQLTSAPAATSLTPYLGALANLSEVFIVVIDTSVVTNEVIKTVKHGLPSPLFLAMRSGLVRGFMAHHTWAEVPRVLFRRGEAENFDPADAERLWWHAYVRVIRFVPAGDLPPADPDLERSLGGRDASDMPTLKVASLIAPVVVLAADRDLQDIGLAYERWWEVPEAIRKVIAGRGGADAATRVLFGAGYGAVFAIRGLARAAQRPAVALALAGIALAAVLTRRHWYPHVERWIDDASPRMREAMAKTGQALYGLFEEYMAAMSIWLSAQRGRPGSSLTHRVARMLATSTTPMTRTEMIGQLADQVARLGHRQVMVELERILRSHQAFWEASRGRWQFGKAGADLGGLALS